jgi:hypothetical protein
MAKNVFFVYSCSFGRRLKCPGKFHDAMVHFLFTGYRLYPVPTRAAELDLAPGGYYLDLSSQFASSGSVEIEIQVP